MFHLLACRCANAEPRMRALLNENHYAKWQSHPMVKGREACMNFLDSLPANKEIDKLKGYIKRQSSWSVIIGTDGKNYEWSDIGHSSLREKLDAEVIIKEYRDDE